MNDGEPVRCSATGLLDGQPMSADLTEHHLVVHYRGEPEPGLVVDLGQILRVEQAAGLLGSSLTLVLADRKISFTRVPKDELGPMVSALRDRATRQRVSPAPEVSKSSPLDDLERLARLHESGALSDAEFATAKATVLGRL